MGNQKNGMAVGIVVVVVVVAVFSRKLGLDMATGGTLLLRLLGGVVIYGLLSFILNCPQKIALPTLLMATYYFFFPAMDVWGAVPLEAAILSVDTSAPVSHWYMNKLLRTAAFVPICFIGYLIGKWFDDK